jgi:hypothetical protein
MKCVILLKILVLGPRFSVFFIWSGSFLEDWKKFFIIFVIDKQFEFQTFALFYCVHVRCSPKHIQHLIIKMCTKSFTTAQHLQYHCRVHTGEKPYQCAVCLNSFASKSYLQIHIKVHTGEKPFKCTVCSKLFLRSGQLKSHMRTHSDKLIMR